MWLRGIIQAQLRRVCCGSRLACSCWLTCILVPQDEQLAHARDLKSLEEVSAPYSGYAPPLVRLLELSTTPGWKAIEESLALLRCDSRAL